MFDKCEHTRYIIYCYSCIYLVPLLESDTHPVASQLEVTPESDTVFYKSEHMQFMHFPAGPEIGDINMILIPKIKPS